MDMECFGNRCFYKYFVPESRPPTVKALFFVISAVVLLTRLAYGVDS